jgi:hypothetical protein
MDTPHIDILAMKSNFGESQGFVSDRLEKPSINSSVKMCTGLRSLVAPKVIRKICEVIRSFNDISLACKEPFNSCAQETSLRHLSPFSITLHPKLSSKYSLAAKASIMCSPPKPRPPASH